MKRTILLALLLVCGTAVSGADDPASRLRGARSLRCTFTAEIATWIRSGHRTIEQTTEKSTVTYDNIDVARGTARIIVYGPFGGGAAVKTRQRRPTGWTQPVNHCEVDSGAWGSATVTKG